MISYAIIAALLYTLPFVLADSISKKVVGSMGAYRTGIAVLSIGLVPAAIAAAAAGFGTYSSYSFILAVATGIMLSLGYMLFYKSIETEQLSNSIAFSELGSAVLVIFGFLVFGESIALVGIAGIAILFFGAALIATTEERSFNRKLIPAALAFTIWSLSYILFAYSIKAAGSFGMPILVSKLVALASFAAFAWMAGFRKPRLRSSASLKSVFSAGLLDGTGAVGFALATALQAIGLTGVINALVPVIGATIGFKFYKERFTRLQLFGFVVMMAGAVIVTLS